MYQTNTLDTALASNRKAPVAIETIEERLLDGWRQLGKFLFWRTPSVHAVRTFDAPPLSDYYAGAYDRVSAAGPTTSFRGLEESVRRSGR